MNPEAPRKRRVICHDPIIVRAEDVYPPELIAAALANMHPSELAEFYALRDARTASAGDAPAPAAPPEPTHNRDTSP